MTGPTRMLDIRVESGFSLVLFRPCTHRGKLWLREHTEVKDSLWFGDVLVVEYKYAAGLFDDMERAGLTIGGPV